MANSADVKERGAYSTDPKIADFLVDWAIRSSRDTIMDPSFGDGVFLESVLRKLKGTKNRSNQIFGVEIDEDTHLRTSDLFAGKINKSNLVNADFFSIDSGPKFVDTPDPESPQLDAIVGNPPFIRYHRFKGAVRERAQLRASNLGVTLNGLSSSWAPFVVHAISFLKSDGRLAMVLPGEIMHATYARPVLRFFAESFRTLDILTFQKKIFLNLSEDTLLMLADGKGHQHEMTRIIDLTDVEDLNKELPKGVEVDIASVIAGETRLIEFLLPSETRELYCKLKRDSRVKRLGDLASIGIGYVTGNNDFFHLSTGDAKRHAIDNKYLRKCVRKGSQLRGLTFTNSDWETLAKDGEPVLLLDLNSIVGTPPDPIWSYLQKGMNEGVHNGFKTRTRKVWWKVPHIYECDGFLSYMSGNQAQLSVNSAGVVAPNSLHIIRLGKQAPVLMESLAVSWLTSLTRLSTEIEGRSLGGGMLKLEPSEARRTLLVVPSDQRNRIEKILRNLDSLIRLGHLSEAQEEADKYLLREILHLSEQELDLLRKGAESLRGRRMNR